MSLIKNIAIVGGSGRSGTHIVRSLVASGKFVVTAITRNENTATFPASVKVHKGDYNSEEFLVSSLQGQEALIILLGPQTSPDIQSRLISAAAIASVDWVLPNEFSPDTGSKELCESVSILASKKRYRDEIEKLGKSRWIGFVTGFWFDFGLVGGFFGIKIKERTARLYDTGDTVVSLSTLPQVGIAVTKLFELPLSTLETFKNRFVYADSFHVSQNDMLESLYKSTGTSVSDWEITKVPVDEAIAAGRKDLENGIRYGMVDVLCGSTFKTGLGGNFKQKSDNGTLGLEEEDFDQVVESIVKNQN